MKLYYVNETGGYLAAGQEEILAAGQEIAKLQLAEPIISTSKELLDYLKLQMAMLKTEQMRVIFVNNMNRVIKEEVVSSGTEDQTAVYPRQIMKTCLNCSATGILAVHNHPSGQLRPSQADILITKSLCAACDTLDIRFLDHVIIGADGDKGYFSFRENGLL